MMPDLPDTASSDEERVIARMVELGADEAAVRKWSREFPLQAFGGKTAYDVVCAGQVDRLLDEIERVAAGGHA